MSHHAHQDPAVRRLIAAARAEGARDALLAAAEEMTPDVLTIDGSYRAAEYTGEYAAWLRDRARQYGGA